MNIVDYADQRKHPRIDVNWSVIMSTPEGNIVGKIENVSCGGAYVRCSTLLSKNDHFTMSIQAPNREPLNVGAKVAWIDIPLTPYTDQVPIGLGVRFTQISREDLQFISDVVSGAY